MYLESWLINLLLCGLVRHAVADIMCMYEIIILCAHIMVKYESMTINNVCDLSACYYYTTLYCFEIASVSGFYCCYDNTELKEEGPVPL